MHRPVSDRELGLRPARVSAQAELPNQVLPAQPPATRFERIVIASTGLDHLIRYTVPSHALSRIEPSRSESIRAVLARGLRSFCQRQDLAARCVGFELTGSFPRVVEYAGNPSLIVKRFALVVLSIEETVSCSVNALDSRSPNH